MDIYLEVTKKRTIAVALNAIGFYRIGKTEEDVLTSLLEYGQRYTEIVTSAEIDFQPPTSLDEINIVHRYEGNATTAFGSPGIISDTDKRKITAADAEHYEKLIRTCWDAFDKALASAQGKELRKGPRGGGRTREKIIAHVRESELAYLRKQGQKVPKEQREDMHAIRIAVLETLTLAVKGKIPEKGPRGGAMWPTPYFVRSVVSHLVDHIWEIENRILD